MTNTYRKLINLFNFFILLTLFSYNLFSQESRLFDKPFNLKVDFNMDFKDLQKNTNDTSFIKTVINSQQEIWQPTKSVYCIRQPNKIRNY